MARFKLSCQHDTFIVIISLITFVCASTSASSCSPLKNNATQVKCQGSLPTSDDGVQYTYIKVDSCSFKSLSEATFLNLSLNGSLVINCAFVDNSSLVINEGAFNSPSSKLSELDLAENNIQRFPSKIFCNLFNLSLLTLTYNWISEVKSFGFDECKLPLITLDLGYNHITALENNTFSSLNKLETLNVAHNLLEFIDEDAFKNLIRLESLNLSNNFLLTLLPNTFLHTPELHYLYLFNNSLGESVYPSFQHLTNLYQLYLQDNNLTYDDSQHCNESCSLSRGIFEGMDTLIILNLNNNKFSTINSRTFDGFNGSNGTLKLEVDNNSLTYIAEDAFLKFKEIFGLSLRNNRLSKIPDIRTVGDCDFSFNEITSLEGLEFNIEILKLFLSHNKIKTIPGNIFPNFVMLYSIDLSHNEIEYIGNNAIHFDFIHSLLLNNNQLTSIENIFSAKNLSMQILNLSHNRLSWIALDSLPFIQELFLSNNFLTEIGSSLTRPNAFQILDISYNQITNLKIASIPDTIEGLYLQNNNLKMLDNFGLFSKPALQVLKIEDNDFKHLCVNWFNISKSVSFMRRPQLFIAGNPLLCSCENSWISDARIMDIQTVPLIDDGNSFKCNKLPGIPLDNLEYDQISFCKSTSELQNTCSCSGVNKKRCVLICPPNCTCFRNNDWSTIITNCRNISLAYVPAGISPDTTALFLDGNSIRSINESSFTNYKNLKYLVLNKTEIESIEEFAFHSLKLLEFLDLSSNHLQNLSANVFAGLVSLVELHLNSNRLQYISPYAFMYLPSLSILRLENNKLTDFPVWNVKNLTSLSLSLNFWTCNCSYLQQFRHWLQDYVNVVKDLMFVTCIPSNGMTFANNSIHYIYDKLCLTSTEAVLIKDNYYIIISLIVIVIVLVTILILLYIYRWEVQVVLYSKYGIRLCQTNYNDDDNEKVYDAFIAYNDMDEEFLVNNILPGLEQIDHPYKLCLHHRDFTPGAFISDSILRAVKSSKRTILLLSNNFIQSEWCRYEFKSAHMQMLNDSNHRVIMILIGDMPKNLDNYLKLYTKTNTYLEWGDKLFWQKLYFALPNNA